MCLGTLLLFNNVNKIGIHSVQRDFFFFPHYDNKHFLKKTFCICFLGWKIIDIYFCDFHPITENMVHFLEQIEGVKMNINLTENNPEYFPEMNVTWATGLALSAGYLVLFVCVFC